MDKQLAMMLFIAAMANVMGFGSMALHTYLERRNQKKAC